MKFNDVMQEVLKGSRYDFLTGRRVDIREMFINGLERVLTWLFGRFNFSLPGGEGGYAGVVAAVFVVIAVVLVIVAGVVVVRAYLRSRVREQHDLYDLFQEMKHYTVKELLEMSYSAKNLREAVRYKYIAAILSLNERDIIVIEPSATSAIILRQIHAAEPTLAAPFYQVAEAFHLTWFGHKKLSGEAAEKVNSAVKVVCGE
jgi:hypothetical protein